jgi:hypothetical protein
MSFNLTVTEEEIKEVLLNLSVNIYPESIYLGALTYIMYGDILPIHERKVRLCIKELRKRGYLIIAKRGYSMAGDDPTEVIHFINGMYSRAHSLTTDADIMYHGLKQKYGDAVSAKVEQLPKQPMIGFTDYRLEKVGEPAFRKSIDARGNEIARQFEYDA